MGEGEKKAEEPKEEAKKEGKVEKEPAKPEEKPAEAKKPEQSQDAKEPKAEKPALPPPPPEIVLKVYMHCEGCARKVRRSLKGFPGVEAVITDCKSHKVMVKGEKADPLKVLERVQKKSHRQVELLSPIPKPKTEEEKKPKKEEKPKLQEKKQEPQVVTVVLKVHMHCDACAQEIKRRIQRMEGVESAEPDLKSSQVSVKGVYDPAKLVEYVHKRTGKHALIVKQEPEPEKKEKPQEEKKVEKEQKKSEGEENKEQKKEGEGEVKPQEEAATAEESTVAEVKKNEYYYYPPRYGMGVYEHPAYQQYPAYQQFAAYQPYPPYQQFPAYQPYPPHLFSDENPNVFSDENPTPCTVM